MSASDVTRLAIVFAVGVVAPVVWIESMFLWSSHVFSPTIKWLWSIFALRGPWTAELSSAAHSLVFAGLCSIVLRFVNGRFSLPAALTFATGFLLALFLPRPPVTGEIPDQYWPLVLSILPEVAFLLGCAIALFYVLAAVWVPKHA
jgi:hypothetical protein